MSELTPKTNNSMESDNPNVHPGAKLSFKEYIDYSRDLSRPDKNRHPQAQAMIEEVYGSAEGDGKYKDVVVFDHTSNMDYINRAHRNAWSDEPVDPKSYQYGIENVDLVPALRAGDMEREFHTERLKVVEAQLADIAMGVKEGTRWQRFKKSLSGGNDEKLPPIPLDREKVFSEGRLEALPTEVESQEMASRFFKRHEDSIRGDASYENAQRNRNATATTTDTEEAIEPTTGEVEK
ncbi:MAG: hypothetical protein JWN75_945 [Candidatus Saccharibacteria bacterium]|nr:hypothetical protein [Candidatus Saccharibacteria bacterium]